MERIERAAAFGVDGSTENGDEAATDYEVRAYRPGDEGAIVAAFNRVFPWARRTVAEWRWQFGSNPEGVRCFVAVRHDGSVAAQFVGWPRRMQIGAITRSASEIVDSFTDPLCRIGLKKPGVFARTAYAYIDRYCRPDAEAFAYGLPNVDAYRIGQRLLGYVPVHDVVLLTREVSAKEPKCISDALDAEEVADIPGDADDLWRRAARAYAASVVRDRRYLAWRYARPGVAYRRIAVRDARRGLVALVVLRDRWLEADFGPDVTAVAECVVDHLHSAASEMPNVLAALTARGGGQKTACVVPPHSREARVLAAAGFRPERTKFRLVGRTYDPDRLSLEKAASSWFWTLGDFDVV